MSELTSCMITCTKEAFYDKVTLLEKNGVTFVREYTSDKKTCRYVTIKHKYDLCCGRVVLERTKYFGNIGYYYDSNYFDLIEEKESD
ncbi:hypothetical protein [Vibrio phage JSF13]|uniref:Uncharacterized protein ORF220 n=1 Tax=Vibrio phage ICP1 TaxID=979525 RepID=F1D1P4_9CAUD|nr:hypothetical protein ViPhICP1_gp222 [Vibrio phage ICP1]ADX88264.1 hypothetical protein TUST1-191_01090 [Vibrio phage ICP1_2006_D]ADX88491.1 hypothetical protein TUST1-182_01090 [Vibrio phage ICP1_2006_C]ADX88715.1 hypothetical protein TUST1-159_01075 [Vibrio phage ICP1_2006_B]ADX88941.1 hypothetical protein TUST1-17_01075 [Vibrio phage ICP1_2006_A]ADX89171.1 hypothetical protein TUST1-15_01095 [Vibrio phage ICP1_2005_A]ADX89401.1 hypothetical protein TUST1-2_01105 [Vibrio phage ICP1_2001_A